MAATKRTKAGQVLSMLAAKSRGGDLFRSLRNLKRKGEKQSWPNF